MKRQIFFFVFSLAAFSGFSFASGFAADAAAVPEGAGGASSAPADGGPASGKPPSGKQRHSESARPQPLSGKAQAAPAGAESGGRLSGFSGSDLSLKGSHFLSDPAFALQLKNYYSLYGGLIYKKEKGRFLFKTDLFAELSLDRTRQFYTAPREIFLSYRYDFQNRRFVDSLTVYFGRHVKEWSRADSYWEFGAWNPLILYEPLSPTEAGLSGAFLDIASKRWLLELYAGGFHLPHVKPEFQKPAEARLAAGANKLKSPNRFADIPPESVDLAGLDLEIDYSVRFFKEELLHDGYGAGLTWMSAPPEEERRLYLKGSFGYKPSNDVFLTRNTRDQVRVKENGKESAVSIDQKIENQVVRQKIVSVESGARFDGFFGWISFLQNKMSLSRALPLDRKFVIKPLDHSYISALAGKRFFLFQDIKTKIQAGWLHSFGLGGKRSFAGQLITRKLLNGFGLDWTASVGREPERSLSLRYWFSPKTWNSLLSLNFLFHFLPKWHVGAGVNILTGERGNKRSFLNRFQSADSVVWRTGYVF